MVQVEKKPFHERVKSMKGLIREISPRIAQDLGAYEDLVAEQIVTGLDAVVETIMLRASQAKQVMPPHAAGVVEITTWHIVKFQAEDIIREGAREAMARILSDPNAPKDAVDKVKEIMASAAAREFLSGGRGKRS